MTTPTIQLDVESIEPNQGSSLADALFERLSEAIVQGEFAPGVKLSEPRLAARFGVSRGSLREAIRRLEERKLVTRTLRQGVRVIVPSRKAAVELFKIREVLEGLAASEAALYRTAADCKDLRAMLARHAKELARPDAMAYWQTTTNVDFHFFIVRIARNERLSDLLAGEYYTILRLYRMQHRMVPGRAQRALVEHGRIADAVIEGDSELASLLMRRHIATARAGIEISMKD